MITQHDRGTPRKYIHKTSTNAAAGGLTETERQDSNGNEPIGATITVDGNAARVRWDGGAPTQTEGHRMHNNQGNLQELYSLTAIKNFDWVSETADSAAEIHITLFY